MVNACLVPVAAPPGPKSRVGSLRDGGTLLLDNPIEPPTVPLICHVMSQLLMVFVLAPAWHGPKPATPRELREVWLRFHETELCQSVDAVFSFHRDGLEVWVQIEDERSYQKLVDMLAPLRGAFTIEIYATRNPPEKKGPDDNAPPPSLWNNNELRRYLQDPLSGHTSPLTSGAPPGVAQGDSEYFLKQRMMMFAGQTLEWNRKLRRYAADLPDLAAAGFGHNAPADLKQRAAEVCRAHAEALDRTADRILANLSAAIPKPPKRGKADATASAHPSSDPVALAGQLAAAGQTLSRRVQQFIFPRGHTVDLEDLKEPGMLESTRTVRALAASFPAASARR